MTIEWTSTALENLKAIHSETAALSVSAATAILTAVLGEIDGLAVSPRKGREGRVMGTRELPMAEMPLVVAYRISGEVIQILAVLQGAAVND
jgi:plasmid stabilization system protein ParE